MQGDREVQETLQLPGNTIIAHQINLLGSYTHPEYGYYEPLFIDERKAYA
jgi:hypothetical protein